MDGWLGDGWLVPSVNEATKKQAPPEAMDQMGHALQRIIEVVATNMSQVAIFHNVEEGVRPELERRIVSVF